MATEKYLKGLELFNKVHTESVKEGLDELTKISPALAEMSIEWVFSDIYSRPQLDLKTRELINIAALVVKPDTDSQIRNHTLAALNVGCSSEQIKEAVLQMTIICGFPNVVNAMIIVEETLKNLDSVS